MARPRTALLTRERIARAAIALVDSGHELQVMPLAKRLGVSVSSIYHHVNGRVGIIHAMREVLVNEHPLTPDPKASWEDTVRSSALHLWHLYGNHPRVMPLLVSVVIDEPVTLDFYAVLVDALAEAGIPEHEQLSTAETIEAFIFGVALDAGSPDTIFQPTNRHPRMEQLIAAHPQGRARNVQLFERGLELLLLGIRERARIATP
ncbi:MAG: TetR/AcrR family transcriptional regulator [Microbacteriaceae bacterium]|nr:TetR/AcrR family transcriptional regulator [Microbacteriaceae bacterium]